MEPQIVVSKKDLNFIDDVDLRNTLRDRLEELDRVFSVDGHYSSVFLAIGCIEGTFKHIAQIFKTEIRASSSYPQLSNGQPKDFDDLTIDDLRTLLAEQDIVPNIKKFEHVYEVFRNYRNFIHPQAHARRKWQLSLGQAQMAVGLLNATISELADYIFIGKNRFRVVSGKPYYSSEKVLSLDLTNESPLQSFVVLDRKISDTLSLNFNLELPQGSVFNFVFNYRDDGDFKMIRLDHRGPGRNRMLHCSQKYDWKETYRTFPENPDGTFMPVAVAIDFPHRSFSFTVDGIAYRIADFYGNPRNMFDEIHPGRQVGFFNEVGPVKLLDIIL